MSETSPKLLLHPTALESALNAGVEQLVINSDHLKEVAEIVHYKGELNNLVLAVGGVRKSAILGKGAVVHDTSVTYNAAYSSGSSYDLADRLPKFYGMDDRYHVVTCPEPNEWTDADMAKLVASGLRRRADPISDNWGLVGATTMSGFLWGQLDESVSTPLGLTFGLVIGGSGLTGLHVGRQVRARSLNRKAQTLAPIRVIRDEQ